MLSKFETFKYKFYGDVQRVSFRKTLCKICRKHNIKGYTKNLDDGGVLAIFQQKNKVLGEFLPYLKVYLELENPLIKIKKIVKTKIKTNTKYMNFEVKYPNIRNKILSNIHYILRKNLVFKKKENLSNFPKHIAIIPDGNRRYLKKSKIKKEEFYESFILKFESFFSYLLGISKKLNQEIYLTLWGFSTENWRRDKKDIKFVFEGLEYFLDSISKKRKSYKFKFKFIGREDRLPKNLLLKLKKLEKETSENKSKLNFILALDYGGRDEIIRAIKKIPKSRLNSLTQENFLNYLDTKEIPNPDLIIRTSNEKRLSGFMPYQSAYSELYFSKKFFPQFGLEDLKKAIRDFQKRKRNFGK